MQNLKIAIQKAGKIREPSIKYLNFLGLKFESETGRLFSLCTNFPAQVFYIRDDDIPGCVSNSSVDLGIVGEDVLYETGRQAKIVKRLSFAKCSLVIAVRVNSKIKSVKDLEGKKIATTYPRLLRKFLDQNGLKVETVILKGSVEVAPELNIADAICDIVETGGTLKAHGLIPLVALMQSQAVLIKSPNNAENMKDFFPKLDL